MTASFAHFVFVDFENVPSIDLALIEGEPVHVTLFIGEKQKRLELPLVRQIHQHASQVSLIEVGASGRNALDLVLAAHLGQSMQAHPDGEFTIISRDHDFDPLAAHFTAIRVRVKREPDFLALPIFNASKPKPSGARSRQIVPNPTAPIRKGSQTSTSLLTTRQKKKDGLADRLRARTNRPKTRESLLHHINTVFGQKLTVDEQEVILNELLALGIFAIPDGKKLVYSV